MYSNNGKVYFISYAENTLCSPRQSEKLWLAKAGVKKGHDGFAVTVKPVAVTVKPVAQTVVGLNFPPMSVTCQ